MTTKIAVGHSLRPLRETRNRVVILWQHDRSVSSRERSPEGSRTVASSTTRLQSANESAYRRAPDLWSHGHQEPESSPERPQEGTKSFRDFLRVEEGRDAVDRAVRATRLELAAFDEVYDRVELTLGFGTSSEIYPALPTTTPMLKTTGGRFPDSLRLVVGSRHVVHAASLNLLRGAFIPSERWGRCSL